LKLHLIDCDCWLEMSRPPAGARGLKRHSQFGASCVLMSRPPAGARGLKLALDDARNVRDAVAPPRGGARIETIAWGKPLELLCRAPPRGRAD